MSNELPAAFRGNKISQEETVGSLLLLRLTFFGESADNPVIAGMIREAQGVDVTLLFGNLDQIHGIPFGRMIIGLNGAEDEMKKALHYLECEDLKIEVIGYVERSYTTFN